MESRAETLPYNPLGCKKRTLLSCICSVGGNHGLWALVL